MMGNWLFDLNFAYPYFAAGILMLGPIIMSWFVKLREMGPGEPEAVLA